MNYRKGEIIAETGLCGGLSSSVEDRRPRPRGRIEGAAVGVIVGAAALAGDFFGHRLDEAFADKLHCIERRLVAGQRLVQAQGSLFKRIEQRLWRGFDEFG